MVLPNSSSRSPRQPGTLTWDQSSQITERAGVFEYVVRAIDPDEIYWFSRTGRARHDRSVRTDYTVRPYFLDSGLIHRRLLAATPGASVPWSISAVPRPSTLHSSPGWPRSKQTRKPSVRVQFRPHTDTSPPQRLDLDVLVPARRAVVLQPDVAGPRMVFIGDVELVLRAIGTAVGGRPLVEVYRVTSSPLSSIVSFGPSHVITIWFHWPTGFMAFFDGFTRS